MKILEYAALDKRTKRIIKQFLSKSFLITPLFLVISCGWITRKPVELKLEHIKTCPVEYEDKLVSTEGYLGINDKTGNVNCLFGGCNLYIRAVPNKYSNVKAEVKFGKGPNRMERLPKEFGDYDVTGDEPKKMNEEELNRFNKSLWMWTEDNKVVGALDKLKITGNFIVYRPDSCYIEVEKIELL